MKKRIKKFLKSFGYDVIKSDNKIERLSEYSEIYGIKSVKEKAFYNISAGGHFGFGGKFYHPYWTNIDVDLGEEIYPRFNPEIDIAHDPLDRNELPIESNSAELFHSRFAIEHIDDDSAIYLFKEIHRTLKKDGIFKIVTPNIRLDYEAYLRNDRQYFWWLDGFSYPEIMDIMKFSTPLNKATLPQVMLSHFAANASMIHSDGADNPISDEEFDSIIRDNNFQNAMNLCTSRCSIEKQRKYRKNHVNWWDYCKLENFLFEAGFEKVISLSAGQSLSPVMRKNPVFDRLWTDVAIYMEAVK